MNLRLFVTMLEKLGYQPLTAKDGLEAIEIYKGSHPEFIFMDLQMPLMNGIEATKKIREIEKKSGMAASFISALTAKIVPEDRQKCFDAGMAFFLNKPINMNDISDVLIEAFHARSQSRYSKNIKKRKDH